MKHPKHKHMKVKKTILISVALLNFVTIFGQPKKWEVNLKEQLYEVGWIEQTNDGLILASGPKGLLALDNNSGEIFDKMSLDDSRVDQSSTNAYGLIGIHTTFEQLESSSPCDTPDPNMKQAPYEPITLNNDQDLSTLYSPINKIIIPGK